MIHAVLEFLVFLVALGAFFLWQGWKFDRHLKNPIGLGPNRDHDSQALEGIGSECRDSILDPDLLKDHLRWFFGEVRQGRADVGGFAIHQPEAIEGLICLGMDGPTYSGRILSLHSVDASGVQALDPQGYDAEAAHRDLHRFPMVKAFVRRGSMGLVFSDGYSYQSRHITVRLAGNPLDMQVTLRRFYGLGSESGPSAIPSVG